MIPMLKGLGWVCPAGAEATGAGVVLGGGGGGGQLAPGTVVGDVLLCPVGGAQASRMPG